MAFDWTLIGVAALILCAIGLASWRRSGWRKIAKKIDLAFTPGPILSDLPGKMSGRYQDFEVVLESLSKGHRSQRYTQTRIAVVVKKRSAIYFYLRGQGEAFPRVPEFDKSKGIGGKTFSSDFFVICHPAGFAIDLLSEGVQDRLKRELDFGVVDYNDDELSITWPGIYYRETEIIQRLELAVYLAAQIKQLRGYL
jgi:hypothetical protein